MEDSRGQIILVAALAIAVTFVALALIVNTVIFTENLATRETVDGQEAVAFDRSVKETGEALMARAHARNASADTDDKDELVSRFKSDIGLLAEAENRHALEGGSMRTIEVLSVRNGTRIRQSTQQAVDSDEGNTTWTTATNVRNTRRFNLNISDYSGSEAFTVNVTDGSSNWTVEVVESGGTYTVEVLKDGTNQGTETVTASNLELGLTKGTINGTDWNALQFGDGVSKPYDIRFENGTNVDASYQLVVDRTVTDVQSALSDEYSDPSIDPTLYSAIYNTTLEYSFTRNDLHYSSNVTLAPEGPPPE